jgi:hypothetical protein
MCFGGMMILEVYCEMLPASCPRQHPPCRSDYIQVRHMTILSKTASALAPGPRASEQAEVTLLHITRPKSGEDWEPKRLYDDVWTWSPQPRYPMEGPCAKMFPHVMHVRPGAPGLEPQRSAQVPPALAPWRGRR